MLAYIREVPYRTEMFFETDRHNQFARTIELTLCTLAGLPEPPMSKRMAAVIQDFDNEE